MKRDKIIQITSHPMAVDIDKENDIKIFKNYIWGLTETGAIYTWNEILGEWGFITLSPEDE